MKRAPEAFQKVGMEWFYRLMKEPQRIKRQIALPLFLLEVAREIEKQIQRSNRKKIICNLCNILLYICNVR